MLKNLWKLFKILLCIVTVLVLVAVAYINLAPTFGAAASGESLSKIKSSSNYHGDAFKNLIPTQVSTPAKENKLEASSFFFPAEGKNPSDHLPSVKFDKSTFKKGDFVWFGHSTILLNTDNVTILTDPIFNNASPIPYTVRPFDIKIQPLISDLPEIDVVIISHDHYDHLDYKGVLALDKKVSRFFVPLGIKAHLLRWGVSAEKITEMDWYETTQYKSVSFTLTPSRHFSGRGLFNRMSTLWGSWVVQSSDASVFFSGDSGYFDEFKKIGEKFGPFDIAFVEDGAYNINWRQIHMMPEESVQTSIDLKAKVLFPIHWGKFDLSLHKWTEPIVRAKKAAKNNNMNVATPRIGEVFTTTEYPQSAWWESVK